VESFKKQKQDDMEQQVIINASLADMRQMIEDVVTQAIARRETGTQPQFVKGLSGAAEFLGVSERTVARNAPKDAKIKFGKSIFYDTTKLLRQ
jgi:hypothetical protein